METRINNSIKAIFSEKIAKRITKYIPNISPIINVNPLISVVLTIFTSPPMNYLKLYKTIIILSIVGLILPSFCAVQAKAEIPETIGEAKDFMIKLVKPLPEKMKSLWQNEVLPSWERMGDRVSNWWKNSLLPWLKNILPTIKSWLGEAKDWLSDIWYEKIKPWIQNILDKIRGFLGKEIEEKKPSIKEEFEKEKQEIKEEIPSLWQKFKELIQ